MNDLVVRPSLRRAKFSLVLCTLFLAIVVWFWRSVVPDAAWWILLVGVLPFLAPVLAWLDTTRTELSVADGLVRYRHGLVTHTTRAMELRKIQDVRVDRSLTQRLWGVGTLILESAGETSRLVVADIDTPQQVADAILRASRQEGPSQGNV